MKKWMMMAALLLISGGAALFAENKITVEANSEDISEELDLKAIATLFGEVKDLSEFETKLNVDSLHISNLDLNADGIVDYLRVIEVEQEKNKHLVVIQAVLATDIFQDVASIYVEQKKDKSVAVQVIGDEYLYGQKYIIEPVYIYRPVIYDWFWGPYWTCYTSPYYWGYWPGWYAPYPRWGYRDYCVHIHVYHHDRPICSYRYGKDTQATSVRNYFKRSDFADANATRSFTARTGMNNARELNTSARMSAAVATAVNSRGAASRPVSTSASRTSNGSATTGRSYSTSYSGAMGTSRSSAASRTSSAATVNSSSSSVSTRPSSSSTVRSSSTVSNHYSGASSSHTTTHTATPSGGYSTSSGSRSSSSAPAGHSGSSGGGYSNSYSGATRR